MSEFNGGGENFTNRRLGEMEAVIQSMITLAHEQQTSLTSMLILIKEQHQTFMEEVAALMDLQKEHRVDIMALFAANKGLRESMKQYLERDESAN